MQLFLLYPWAFSKFAFNHRILAMIFLTGNFLNAVDRDGLHGSLLDPMLLCASDKTRLGLSCSECLERYSHLIIPLVIWMGLWEQEFMARYWPAKALPDSVALWEHLGWCVFFCHMIIANYMSGKDKCVKYSSDWESDKARGRHVSWKWQRYLKIKLFWSKLWILFLF